MTMNLSKTKGTRAQPKFPETLPHHQSTRSYGAGMLGFLHLPLVLILARFLTYPPPLEKN